MIDIKKKAVIFMKILCIGDVCGKSGCEAAGVLLPKIKLAEGVDLTIVNGENSADGNGILPSSANMLFSAGADVITGGNHTIRRREIYEILENNERMLRPANLPSSTPGRGYTVIDMGYTSVAVVNILGVIFMENMACPFNTADQILQNLKNDGIKNIIVDFHAEATSEKRALGFYLDGRVSALFGTHTHVRTADGQILPQGSGYITDIGMTGAIQSVLGVEPQLSIQRLRDKMPVHFKNAGAPFMLCGCIFDIDHRTGLCKGFKQIYETLE